MLVPGKKHDIISDLNRMQRRLPFLSDFDGGRAFADIWAVIMLVYDDLFAWEGWGGKLRLGSGSCRLRIFDLQKEDGKGIKHLRPIIAVVIDVPESRMSIKSCAGHIATRVTAAFNIDPHRMLYLEYYPWSAYGERGQHVIPDRYEAVEFTWHDGKAIQPKWRSLKPPMLDTVKKLMK